MVGYNPLKPGRPSHAYHSFMVGGVRLILDVAVEPGNRHSSKRSEPHLWDHLGRQPRACWPTLVRGDKDWGSQRNMRRCEQEGVHYLFKPSTRQVPLRPTTAAAPLATGRMRQLSAIVKRPNRPRSPPANC